MGLIEIFFNNHKAGGQFLEEKAYNRNRNKMVKFTPKVLEQLRNQDVPDDKAIKLEYIFYTNTAEKAGQLAFEIEKRGYTADHGPDPVKKKLFMVSGMTTAMKTSDSIILQWTEEMCELGYKFDCEFDGWAIDLGLN